MALTEIKKQVVLMLQSVLSLDSTGRTEAMGFLKDCAINFGLEIPNGVDIIDKSEAKDTEISNNNVNSILLNPNNAVPSAPDITPLNCNLSQEINNSNNDNNSINYNNNNILSQELKPNLKEHQGSGISETESVNNMNEEILDLERVAQEKVQKVKKSKSSSNRLRKVKENITKHKDNVNKTKELKTNKEKKLKRKIKSSKEDDQENGVFKCPGCSVTCSNKSTLFMHFSSHSKAPMSCRLCRSNFNNILHFWRHQKKNECKISLFKCVECGEKFKYRRHYLKHILGHNDNNCRYCDEKFSTWILYKHHLKEKHPDIKMERDLIPCKFCAMSFRRHLGLYNHYQVEHSKGKFVCLSCGILLPTKEKYKEHALVHESEKTWKCKICKMKFYRRQQLLFHVSVHKSGTYKCLTCDITVTSKADLYKHKKEGHEVKGLEPKFECELCHKNFKKKVVLKNHMATHSNEKKYYCKYCVKSFSTLDALQKHEKRKSHFEKAKIILPESKYEKVYEDKLICENCGKQYKTQRELTWHLRVHKSIYECDECGKTFTLKVNLTKHLKLHRNKVCVICELCGNTFNQLSALNEHNLMKHSDVRNAECEVCKKKFKRKSELNRHKRIHEQKRPFVCFCGTAFKQSSHLQTHFRNFHEKTAEQTTSLIQPEDFAGGEATQVFNETSVSRRKQEFVGSESGTLLSLGNVEPETGYRNPSTYDTIQVNEGDPGKAPYVNGYSMRYPQNGLDPINVTYEELNFGNSQSDRRGLVFSSPAVDLSMVAISEVVQNDISLGHRDLTESVEPYSKIPDDPSSIQLVNLSEHIVQEYLLNLP